MKITAEKDQWFIVDNSQHHNGKLKAGESVESKYDIKSFETESEYLDELQKLNATPTKFPIKEKMEQPNT